MYVLKVNLERGWGVGGDNHTLIVWACSLTEETILWIVLVLTMFELTLSVFWVVWGLVHNKAIAMCATMLALVKTVWTLCTWQRVTYSCKRTKTWSYCQKAIVHYTIVCSKAYTKSNKSLLSQPAVSQSKHPSKHWCSPITIQALILVKSPGTLLMVRSLL